jgi:hypothetical protein
MSKSAMVIDTLYIGEIESGFKGGILRPIKYIIGRKADDQKAFKLVQGTRFGRQ